VNILVCDDHALVRSAMSMAASEIAPDAQVLVACDWTEALAKAHPQVALCLIDLHMPGAEPLEGLRGLQAAAPDAKLVVVSGSESDEDLLGSLNLGVDGFIPKAADFDVLAAALRLVLAGGRYLPPRLAEIAARLEPAAPAPVEAPFGRLSERQAQILRRMSEGLANKEIARELGLSPTTVKTHVAHVMSLLGAANRTEAAAKARALGLV
jgi:DNA-binding NarL/FixJ family response regulator